MAKEMSLYEQALEEWKQRDPYLLDMEGFEQFLAEMEEQAEEGVEWKTAKQYWVDEDGEHEETLRYPVDPGDRAPKYGQRRKYCEERFKDVILRAVLEEEFGYLPDNTLRMIKRGKEILDDLGDVPFIGIKPRNPRSFAEKVFGEGITGEKAEELWRLHVKNPIWFRDFENAVGVKGYSGDRYWLRWWFALCVKLGRGEEAEEVVNNLPKELRHPEVLPPYIEERMREAERDGG